MATAVVRSVPHSDGRGWHVAIWMVQILLAAAFLMAGGMKIVTPMVDLARAMPWTTALPEWGVRAIGIAEVLGALGLILPAATRKMPSLTPTAAGGLFIIMVLAAAFHISRGETNMIVSNVVLGLLALFVLWGRAYKVLLKKPEDVAL